MIEIRHFRTIKALRDTGSLAGAAELLCLTQSALSHQLGDLERYYDCQLFLRKSKPLRFTPAGQRLLKLAEELLPRIAQLEGDLRRFAQGDAGRLHMAIECHSCFDWLLPAIERYREQWPGVELDFASGFNFAPLPALQRGELDLVITADPLKLEGLFYIPLFEYENLAALVTDHPLSERPQLSPADFADQVLITYPVDRQRLDIFSRFLDPAGITPAELRTAELTMMIVQLVASGRGISVLPNWALHEYRRKARIITRPLGARGLWSTLFAAVRESQYQLPYVQGFLSAARATCFETLKGIRRPAAQHPE